MKELRQWMLAAILICGPVALLTSCSTTDNPVPSTAELPDIDPEDINLTVYDWDYDLPGGIYLSPDAYDELRETFVELMGEEPQMAINDDTYLVILDKVSDLPGEKWVELYQKGVTIGVAHPKKADLDALYEEYPDLGYYCDDDDIDKSLLFAISSFNNGTYIIPDPEQFKEEYSFSSNYPDTPDPADAEAGEYDPNEPVTYAGNGNDYDQLFYSYIAFLEELISEQEKYAEEEAQARAMTRAGDEGNKQAAQIKKAPSMVHIGKSGVLFIDQVYFRSSYRFTGNAPVTASYDIYPLHVYEGENGAGDYYFINMAASINTETMYKGKDSFTTSFFPVCLRWCGAYPTRFRVSSQLINADNDNEVSDLLFPAEGSPIPSTVNKNVEHSESKTFSIGCGISGGYKGKDKAHGGNVQASVNPSWSWTDTKKWNVKDVDIENQMRNNTAGWALVYNNLPEFQWSKSCGYNEGESSAKKATTTINGSWVWYIPNVADDSEEVTRRIKFESTGNFGFQRFWATKADNKTFNWDASWSHVFTLPKIVNFTAGNLILKNDTKDFISNIMVYDKDGKEMTRPSRFQNSYPAGSDINLGAFKCSDDLIVKFKKDGKTYVYNKNQYVKTVFKDNVELYVSTDFREE